MGYILRVCISPHNDVRGGDAKVKKVGRKWALFPPQVLLGPKTKNREKFVSGRRHVRMGAEFGTRLAHYYTLPPP